MKKSIIVGLAAVAIGSSVPVFAQENFFDRLDDRIDRRLDTRGDRISERLDA